jgi:hypothetical protein
LDNPRKMRFYIIREWGLTDVTFFRRGVVGFILQDIM